MKCLSCGAENPDGMAFCSECGSKIEIQTQAPVQETAAVAPVPAQPVAEAAPKDRTVPLGVFQFIGVFLVMMLPVINIILLFKWAFSKKTNINLRNYAIAVLILFLLTVAAMVCLGFLIKDIYAPIVEFLKQIAIG